MAFSPLNASLVGGVVASLVGLVVFLAIHHVWIRPIWFIAPPGATIALLGGLALGWAYHEIGPGLPAPPWRWPAVALLWVGLLLPATLLSLTHGPLFDLATATIPPGRGRAVALHVVVELLLTATVAGALAGWLLGGSPRAAAATALAGLAIAIGPGHNVPLFGTNPVALKGFAILLTIVLASSVTLVESAAWLSRR